MASAFNLTAQINLRGPTNLKPIVANIKRQLGSVSTNVQIKLDSRSSKSIDIVTNRLKAMNTVLTQVNANATDLNNTLSSLSAALGSIRQSSSSVSTSVNKVSQNMQQTSKNIKVARTEMEEFGKQSFLAIKRFAAFTVVTTGVFALTNAITSGFKAFIQFDKELIKLQQVTGKGAIGISGLEKEITRLATTLGVSSESLTSVASTLAQAGLSAEDTRIALAALAKTELAPSFDNITDTTEGAIAALRQFELQAGQLESALGSINAVAAAFAVESKDIISAIQRTGGVFASASKGVSEGTDALNEFIAIFTSVRQTTRESAETIATGLRTIFTRIQRSSTVDLLKQYGVELRDLEGQFVGPFEAVKRLSAALSSIDPRSASFAKIVEELGGFRQVGKVIPLIQQFAVAQQALGIAQKGQSSLTDAQIIAQKSLANQIAKVREQFLALIRDVGKSTVFQGLFKIVTGLASSLISLASAFKPILPILAIFGAIKGISAVTQFASGFSSSFSRGGGSKAAGQNIGGAVTGSKDKERAEATSRAADAIRLNTDALKGLTTAVNSLETTIRSRGSATLASGGRVLGFNKGGLVPGYGGGDKVPAFLEGGEVVFNKEAVRKYGADNLLRMNNYAKGGQVQKFNQGKIVRKLAPKNEATNKSHIGADIQISKADIQNYAREYNNAEFFRSAFDNAGVTRKDLEDGRFNYSDLINKMQLRVKERVVLNLPSNWNQALRTTNPDLVAKNDLMEFIKDKKNNIFTGQYSRLPNKDRSNIRQQLASTISSLRTKKYTGRSNPPPAEFPDIPAFDLDNELDSLKDVITQNNLEEADFLDFLFKPSVAGSSYVSRSGQTRRRTQSRSGAAKAKLFNIGGSIQQFAGGGKALGARSRFNELSEQEIAQLSTSDLIQYGKDLMKDIFTTGGAGMAVGHEFIEVPKERIIPELDQYLTSYLGKRGFWREKIAPFGKEIQSKTTNNTKINKQAALESQIAKQADEVAAREQQWTKIRSGSEIDNYILSKLQEPVLSDYKTVRGGGSLAKTFHNTRLRQAVNKALEEYDDFDYSPANIDKLVSRMAAERFAYGGLIQRFVEGGTAQSVGKISESVLARLEDLGGKTGIIGLFPSARDKDRSAGERLVAAVKEAEKNTGLSAGQLLNSKVVGAKLDSAAFEPYLKKVIESAEAVKKAREEKRANQMALNMQAAGGGAYQFGLASIYGPNGELGFDSLTDAKEIEGKDGQKYLTQIVQKSLPTRYAKAIEETRMDLAGAPGRGAARMQYADIFGAGGPLAFDFDETLVKGADIPGKKALDYNDLTKVEAALENAELTLLGKELAKRLIDYPKLIDNIRVLTARPQSNDSLLAATLSRLSLPIPASKITGVSGGLNKVNNLSELETLIDDNMENIESVLAGGKRAIPYTEPSSLDPSQKSSARNLAMMESYAFEEMLRSLGVSVTPDEDANPLRPIDYPGGLGKNAYIWGFKPNMPVDTKRTNSSDAVRRLFEEAEKYYVQNFADGGIANFDKVKQQIMEKYPQINFRISKRKRGFGYNLLAGLKKEGSNLGNYDNFQQASSLDKLMELADKMAGQIQYKKLAGGGSNGTYINARVSNGEAFVPPDLVNKIGESKLDRLNKADTNSITKFSSGGISIFKGPGSGTSDSIKTKLPVGSYILRRRATEALGLYKNGGSVGVQNFATGGRPTPDDEAFFEYKARKEGISVKDYLYQLSQQLGKKTYENTGEQFAGRVQEMKYELAGRKDTLSNIGSTIRQAQADAAKGDVGAAQRLSDAQSRLSIETENIAKEMLALNPTLDMKKVEAASQEIATFLSNGELVNAQEALVKALDKAPEGAEAMNIAMQQLAKQLGIDADLLNRQFGAAGPGAKQLQQQQFIQSREGQRFGMLAEIAPRFTEGLSKTILGKGLAKGADFISGKGGKFSKLFAGLGGVAGIGGGVAFGAEALKNYLPQSVTSNPNTAGVLGGLSGAGSGAASGALLGSAAGPIGALIGGIGGALIGGIKGYFSAKNTQILTNALDKVSESAGKVDSAFKLLEKNSNDVNYDAAQKAFGNFLTASEQINQIGLTPENTGILPNLTGMDKEQRREALGAMIQNAQSNVQNAAILAQQEANRTSTEELSKTLKELESNTISVLPTIKAYQDAAIKAAEERNGAETDLTQTQIENIRTQYEAQAAIDAYSNQRKQSGATEEQINKSLREDNDKALAQGKEIIRQNDILAKKQQILARAMKAVETISESLTDVFRRIDAAITRFSQGVDKTVTGVDNRINDISGNASISKVDRTNEQILGNISGYSTGDVQKAVQSLNSRLGGGEEATRLTNIVLASKTITDKLPGLLRTNSDPTKAGNIVGLLRTEIEKVAPGGKIDDAIEQALSEVGNTIDKQLQSDQNVNIADLGSDTGFIQKISEILSRGTEIAANLEKARNDALDKSIELQNKWIDVMSTSIEYSRKAAQIGIESQLELKKTLGQTLSLDQLNEPFAQSIQRMTGGTTDPSQIADTISELRKEVVKLENERSEILTRPGGENSEAFKENAAALAKNRLRINDNVNALKKLADSTEKATNVLNKLGEQRQRVQAGGGILKSLVFGDAQSRLEAMRGFGAVIQARSAIANNQTDVFGNGMFLKDLGVGLDAIKEFAPDIYKQVASQSMIAAMKESGMTDKELDKIVDFGDGLQKSMRQLIMEGIGNEVNPRDPLVKAYLDAVEQQKNANIKLAEINENLLVNISFGTTDLLTRLSEEFPKIVRTAFQEARADIASAVQAAGEPRKPVAANPPARRSREGIVYASQGQLIDFKPKGKDTIPAMLEDGEFVVNRKSTQKYLPILESINRAKGGNVSYFAEGGMASSAPFDLGTTTTYNSQNSFGNRSMTTLSRIQYESRYGIPGVRNNVKTVTDDLYTSLMEKSKSNKKLNKKEYTELSIGETERLVPYFKRETQEYYPNGAAFDSSVFDKKMLDFKGLPVINYLNADIRSDKQRLAAISQAVGEKANGFPDLMSKYLLGLEEYQDTWASTGLSLAIDLPSMFSPGMTDFGAPNIVGKALSWIGKKTGLNKLLSSIAKKGSTSIGNLRKLFFADKIAGEVEIPTEELGMVLDKSGKKTGKKTAPSTVSTIIDQKRMREFLEKSPSRIGKFRESFTKPAKSNKLYRNIADFTKFIGFGDIDKAFLSVPSQIDIGKFDRSFQGLFRSTSAKQGAYSSGKILLQDAASTSVLYHELAHKALDGFRVAHPDAWTSYQKRVLELFNNGKNKNLIQAFDSLGSAYKSSDVIYGAYYKEKALQRVLNGAKPEVQQEILGQFASKFGVAKLTPNQLLSNLGKASNNVDIWSQIDDLVTSSIRKGGIDPSYTLRNGQEEFLTTLIDSAKNLDQNMRKILDDTLQTLFDNAGIPRDRDYFKAFYKDLDTPTLFEKLLVPGALAAGATGLGAAGVLGGAVASGMAGNKPVTKSGTGTAAKDYKTFADLSRVGVENRAPIQDMTPPTIEDLIPPTPPSAEDNWKENYKPWDINETDVSKLKIFQDFLNKQLKTIDTEKRIPVSLSSSLPWESVKARSDLDYIVDKIKLTKYGPNANLDDDMFKNIWGSIDYSSKYPYDEMSALRNNKSIPSSLNQDKKDELSKLQLYYKPIRDAAYNGLNTDAIKNPKRLALIEEAFAKSAYVKNYPNTLDRTEFVDFKKDLINNFTTPEYHNRVRPFFSEETSRTYGAWEKADPKNERNKSEKKAKYLYSVLKLSALDASYKGLDAVKDSRLAQTTKLYDESIKPLGTIFDKYLGFSSTAKEIKELSGKKLAESSEKIYSNKLFDFSGNANLLAFQLRNPSREYEGLDPKADANNSNIANLMKEFKIRVDKTLADPNSVLLKDYTLLPLPSPQTDIPPKPDVVPPPPDQKPAPPVPPRQPQPQSPRETADTYRTLQDLLEQDVTGKKRKSPSDTYKDFKDKSEQDVRGNQKPPLPPYKPGPLSPKQRAELYAVSGAIQNTREALAKAKANKDYKNVAILERKLLDQNIRYNKLRSIHIANKPETIKKPSRYQEILNSRRNAYLNEKRRRQQAYQARYMNNGGVVYASAGLDTNIFKPKGTDTIPAMLSRGEYVVNARDSRRNRGLLNSINSGNSPSSGPLGSGTIRLDKTSELFMSRFVTSLNSFGTSFGSYVDKLNNITFPNIPDKIELTGNYQLQVNITGAAALETLDKRMKELAVSLIEPKLNELRDETAAATNGAVKSSVSRGKRG